MAAGRSAGIFFTTTHIRRRRRLVRFARGQGDAAACVNANKGLTNAGGWDRINSTFVINQLAVMFLDGRFSEFVSGFGP
jgi:hypothetical protein